MNASLLTQSQDILAHKSRIVELAFNYSSIKMVHCFILGKNQSFVPCHSSTLETGGGRFCSSLIFDYTETWFQVGGWRQRFTVGETNLSTAVNQLIQKLSQRHVSLACEYFTEINERSSLQPRMPNLYYKSFFTTVINCIWHSWHLVFIRDCCVCSTCLI